MPSCVVSTCRNHTATHQKSSGITFHRFPLNGECKIKWIAAIRSSRDDEYWEPSRRSVVCSEHFQDDDFYATKTGLRKVIRDRYPRKLLFPRIDEVLEIVDLRNPANTATNNVLVMHDPPGGIPRNITLPNTTPTPTPSTSDQVTQMPYSLPDVIVKIEPVSIEDMPQPEPPNTLLQVQREPESNDDLCENSGMMLDDSDNIPINMPLVNESSIFVQNLPTLPNNASNLNVLSGSSALVNLPHTMLKIVDGEETDEEILAKLKKQIASTDEQLKVKRREIKRFQQLVRRYKKRNMALKDEICYFKTPTSTSRSSLKKTKSQINTQEDESEPDDVNMISENADTDTDEMTD